MARKVLIHHRRLYDLAFPRSFLSGLHREDLVIAGILTPGSYDGGGPDATGPLGFPRRGAPRRRFDDECRGELVRQYGEAEFPLLESEENDATAVIRAARETGAEEVWLSRLPGTEEAVSLDTLIPRLNAALPDIPLRYLPDDALFGVEELPFPVAGIPDTFSRFRRGVEKRRLSDYRFAGFPLRSLPDDSPGRRRLRDYLFRDQRILSYAETRNGLGPGDYSSRLSPWLSAGLVTAREVGAAILEFEETIEANASTGKLMFELLWREYFRHLARRLGPVLFRPRGMKGIRSPGLTDGVPWRFPAGGRHETYRERYRREVGSVWNRFRSWARGETGEPLADAAMRDLWATGWISNRARQCAASYLIHDLAVPWWWGAQWFESLLIDYDVASNWGNWAYIAGVGADARPVRRFNLRRQAETYDPDGAYIDGVRRRGWSVPPDALPAGFPGGFRD